VAGLGLVLKKKKPLGRLLAQQNLDWVGPEPNPYMGLGLIPNILSSCGWLSPTQT